MLSKLSNQTIDLSWRYPDINTIVVPSGGNLQPSGYVDFSLNRTNEDGQSVPVFSVEVTPAQVILNPLPTLWVRNPNAPPAFLTVPPPLFTPAAFNGVHLRAQGLQGGAFDAATTVGEPGGGALSASRITSGDGLLAVNLAGLSFLPTDKVVVNLS